MRVTVIGEPAMAPLLLAANHTSWLDITVLGGLMKPLSFVAKLEVAGWPILGTLARLQRTIFIDRTRRSHTGVVVDESRPARRQWRGRRPLCRRHDRRRQPNPSLPERADRRRRGGRRDDGGDRSAGGDLLCPDAGHPGRPRATGRPSPGMATWTSSPHFRRIISRGAVDVVVRFGEPIPFGPQSDRKRVAEQCYEAVRRMIEDAADRPVTEPPSGPSILTFGERG